MSIEDTKCKYFVYEQGKKYPVYCKYFEVKERINPKCILCSDDTINEQTKTKNSI